MAACSQTASEDHKVLSVQPWLPVCIGGRPLLAKAWFGDAAYHILLTDTRGIWEERMDTSAIQNRAQELNKRLRAPVKAFYTHLRDVALPCLTEPRQGEKAEGEAQVSLVSPVDGGGLSIRLKSELAGLPFHWEFHCTPPAVDMVCSELVRPLLVMSQLLQAQVDQLGALLAQKDAEIQDYKENGATLSRARLQTEVFDEQTYRDNMVTQVLPQVSSDQREDLGFNADLRELYSAVVAHSNHKRKRTPSEDRSDDDDAPLLPAATGEQGLSHAPTPGAAGAARGESTRSVVVEEEEPGQESQPSSRAKMADQQCPERPASTRPKKKKAVGLFR